MAVRKGLDLGMRFLRGTHRCPPARLLPCRAVVLGSGAETQAAPSLESERGPGRSSGSGLRGAGRAGRAVAAAAWAGLLLPFLPPRLTLRRQRGRPQEAAAQRLRGSRPSRGRVAATAAARQEVEVEAQAAAEEQEGGVHAARPLQEEAMNGDRTESDWQGLVSEVRPRRRPGGMGRAERPPAPGPCSPGGRAGAGTRWGDGGGDVRAVAAAPFPRATRQVRCSSRTFRSIPVPLSSTPSGDSLWGGAFPRAGLGPGLEREARDPGGEGAKPHLPS